MKTIDVERPGQHIRFAPVPGMTPAEIDEQIERCVAFGERAIANGDSMRLRWKLIRHTKVGFYLMKNVGPPPWPVPKVFVSFRHGISVGCGWRSTAYSVGLIVRRAR